MTVPINGAKFYRDHPGFQPKLEGRGHRVILELFLKIVCNFWRSTWSHLFPHVSLDSTTEDKIKEQPLRSNASCVISKLTHKRTLGPTTICECCKGRENLALIENFMHKECDDNLPKIDPDKNLIFVPTVLVGCRNHIIAIIYDRVANRVELYDPKGLVSLDRSDWVLNRNQLMLIDVLQSVVTKYGDNETRLWENTRKHQRDSHNCGLYVLNYLFKRLEGVEPDKIEGPSYTVINNAFRVDLLKVYLSTLSEETQTIEIQWPEV